MKTHRQLIPKTCSSERLRTRPMAARLAGAGLALVFTSAASAQLTPEWVARRAGVDGFFFGFQVPVYMVTDSQGAVYVSNSTLRVIRTDIQTVKYASDGTEVWSVTYDGPSQHADRARGITIDSAGDILVLGQSEGVFLVIKYDASDGSMIGTMQHEPGGNSDIPNAFTTDDAGNIYITGQSWDDERDFYTVKMDSLGNVLWTARYAGPGPFLFAHDIAIDIALDSNGDVFVTGPSNSPTAFPDYATIKYRGSDGAQLWLDRYHLSTDTPVDLIIDSQDNVYVTGFTEGQNHRITTIKYRNSDGARLWVALDTPAVQNFATSLALDSQGDVYVAGRADPDFDESNGNDNAVVIRHRASDGARLWTTLYGENAVGHFDAALDIIIDASDNVYISGQTSSFGASADLLILQYDAASGQIVDQGTYDIPGRLNKGQALALDSAQNVIVAGTTRGNTGGFFDFLTLKYPGQGSLIGDINCDGAIDAFDIEPFLLALFDPDDYAIQYPDCDINNADINADGSIDAFDIEPFLELLFGP